MYFRQEMDFVKSVLVKNGYPQNFINSLFTKFLQLKYTADIKYPVFGPQKKPIYISLPYCGLQSQKLARQLKRIYSKIAPWTYLICLFKPVKKLNSLSKLKSPYKLLSQSGVVYKISCLDCPEFYIGLTQRILQIRLNEHSKCDKSSIYDHRNKTKHNINFTSPEILDKDSVKLRLQIKETLHIKEQSAYNSLNQNTGFFPLNLW